MWAYSVALLLAACSSTTTEYAHRLTIEAETERAAVHRAEHAQKTGTGGIVNIEYYAPNPCCPVAMWHLEHFLNHEVEDEETNQATNPGLCAHTPSVHVTTPGVTTPEGSTAFYLTRLADETDVLDLSQMWHCETNVPLCTITCPQQFYCLKSIQASHPG